MRIGVMRRLEHPKARQRATPRCVSFARRFALGAAVTILLTACATSRDSRTPAELERDAETWTRAHDLKVATAPEQIQGCTSLGTVSERYFEGPPDDPLKRPMSRNWAEHVLRFKTASLGGDTAYLCPSIRKWSGELQESRVLGEAYLCRQPSVATASR
jgi:hypothetical protein